MTADRILSRVKGHVYREVIAPICAPYMPPAYRHFWRTPSGEVLENVLEPYKRHKDRVLFQKRLRPSDVFIVGHPKSGNTWMAYMLAKLSQGNRLGEVTMANVGSYVPVIHGQDSRIGEHEGLNSPRIFRNEYPVYPHLYPKTIYLVRDPRSVLVSYYQMYGVVNRKAPMSLRAFVEEYLDKGYIATFEPLVRWDRQVGDWHARSQSDASILIVLYEDMVKDRSRALERAARFAGIPYSATQFAAVVEQSSFFAMKKDEELHGAESYLNVKEKRGSFIRRGKTDGWKEEMEPDLIVRVEHAFAPVMKALGYAKLESSACRTTPAQPA